MFQLIRIIDYGMGNLRSVQKAVEFLGFQADISSNIDEIKNSTGIILPGVGAFPDAMKEIKEKGFDVLLKEMVYEKKIPLLGICLGMQLLFDESDEVQLTEGLGFIKGRVKKLEVDLKIPHMGWNNLKFNGKSPILEGVKEDSYVYFVHSFYADMANIEDLKASAEYGVTVPAVVAHENVYGTQFHPEKSGEAGMKMLKNFLEMVK
ncbi:MAG: imidazole glycerol phosphate synthase subunit HisH [Bacillota bacterium]|nr:imidazole glycerol phosphate synthase subunit HisH [Bacillota bacterium]